MAFPRSSPAQSPVLDYSPRMLPMRGFATLPAVQEAEQAVDRTARQLLRGEAGLSAWYRVLRQYEEAWMLELERARNVRAERCAA